MTKVEARLAYEERCRRRRRQQIGGQLATRHRRDELYQSHTATEPHSDSNRLAAASIPPSNESSAVVTPSLSVNVTMSPGAPEFIPTTAAAAAAGRHP